MARVTVEDCVERVPNRFELVMLAAQRARNIAAGGSLTIDRDNDKNPVVALREIAEDTVPLDSLRNGLIKGHQRLLDTGEGEEEEIVEFMAEEQGWIAPQDDTQGEAGLPVGEDADEAEDVFVRMEEDPAAAVEGEEADLIDQNVDDEGKAYD